MLNDESHPMSIPQLVCEAPFPVYGLIGNPLELAVCSVSWGSFPIGHRLQPKGCLWKPAL